MTELLDPQSEWARLLIGSFAAADVRDIVSSPGSRSTPFLLAAADAQTDGRVRVCSIVDERAAAFFALGQARVSGRPSLLLCTSGSAAAHYMPALVEARAAHVPLLALTADRPLEAQFSGAHQTIEQTKLFGDLPLRYVELGGADADEAALRGLRRLVAHACALAASGPVHLNARARKPLEPHPPRDAEELAQSTRIRAAATLAPSRVSLPRALADDAALQRLAARITEERAGVFVVGPAALSAAATRDPLLALAAKAGYPILAEATSMAGNDVLVGGASMFASSAARNALRPRLVVQVGATPVNAGLTRLLDDAPSPHLEILSSALEADAESRAAALIVGELAHSCARLAAMLDARELVRDDRYAQKWKRTARALGREIERALTSRAELACILALLVAIPDGAQLMIGNSLPVREADLACLTGVSAPRVVLHQRGAAGIDGLVAGASGAASFGTPTVLLLGDVSLLHDLHGLLVAGRRADNLIIAVIDNAGGRIFDGLAIGRRADLAGAHALFTTPHTHDLAALAQFAGVAYARAEVAEAIAPLVRAASARRGATLLHVVVDAESAARLDAALPRLIEAALTAEERAS